VEWDHLHWKERAWISITDYTYVFIEDRAVLTRHPSRKQLWPALVNMFYVKKTLIAMG